MTDKPCSKCGGPRTWPDQAYCLTCNREYHRQWMADPDNRRRAVKATEAGKRRKRQQEAKERPARFGPVVCSDRYANALSRAICEWLATNRETMIVLAEELNVSAQQVRAWRTCRRRPSRMQFGEIREVLGLDLSAWDWTNQAAAKREANKRRKAA